MINDFSFDSSAVLARQLAESVAKKLQQRIDLKGRACLAVSGGKTPVLFFDALSKQDIEWSKIVITLVDERWVEPDHDSSNGALVKENLIKNLAAKAYFLPLKNKALTPSDGYMTCENSLHEQVTRMDVAVFGMGADGHTASWFPGSKALEQCFSDTASAWSAPVSDSFLELQRMTLTWACFKSCQHLYLHFEGAEKAEVFKRASEQGDVKELPVRKILHQSDVPLSVYHSS